MKAALIDAFGAAPRYGDFREPVAAPGEVRLRMRAAALHPLVRGQASGSHYSSGTELPFVPGFDGVGDTDDGQRLFMVAPRAPFGTMAEWSVTRADLTFPVPDDVDDVTAAAIGNPGMSSWAALTHRAEIRAGERVLILGATGTAGRLAVQIARHLGAARVVACGRNAGALRTLTRLGADATISLVQPKEDLVAALRDEVANGLDIVLDYLWGEPALAMITAIHDSGAHPIRMVQIGSMAGRELALPSAVLRSSGLMLLGSGLGSVPMVALLQSIRDLLRATRSAGFTLPTAVTPLAEVGDTWQAPSDGARQVFLI